MLRPPLAPQPDDVPPLLERDRRTVAAECDPGLGSDARQRRLPSIRIEGSRFVPRQTEDDGPIGGVPLTCQRQGPIERRFQPRDARQQSALTQQPDKPHRRGHGPHGVRTGWPDAQLEKVEDADRP